MNIREELTFEKAERKQSISSTGIQVCGYEVRNNMGKSKPKPSLQYRFVAVHEEIISEKANQNIYRITGLLL